VDSSSTALDPIEILAVVTGLVYVVLAARRNRLCWVAGAVSSAATAYTVVMSALPLQALLQVYYVVVAGYGWFNWTRSAAQGELPVGIWPYWWHLVAAVVLTALSLETARLVATGLQDDWPLLDSLTLWFSLLATWLQARARLENWVYWVVIDALSAFMFFAQQKYWLSVLMVLYVVIAAAGFVAWRRRFRAQAVPA
jgi:nicotinamide mononucleotide transporter